ncbi:mRNA cap guanine-N7 methyltransferase [Friedmanniomyces endolithicus]|nr:mRNA cap guanine-N7 methyltransferase [Friedmanniomyces endolithicus]KAK0856045.1 mRNA cap guanine-N7 methyltransferase [Friedmanniomyces endolithicus]KAK0913391.1 mRNA cap guanine-N7 methyltransferase [Friedmanniomyces endolithicus]
MANDEPLDKPSNVTEPRKLQKRKREAPSTSHLSANKSARTGTPNAFARRTPPPAPIDDDEPDTSRRSPPKQLKRPGAGARVTREQREAADALRRQREDQQRQDVAARQAKVSNAELVAEHYNAVPERGREWRKTDSQIKGLRSLNNWIKSTLIQKFSRPDGPLPPNGLTVLDMACGKGGDLGKWEKAPVVPALYVGCDIAEVSVSQAKERYAEGLRKSNNGRYRRQQMRAEFYVQDTFGRSLGEIPIVNQVGFNPHAGPGGSRVIQGGMMTGGFDVVSMMFALHYSFESETLARGMLGNVAGALKKGGRFIGVMPNSDVISAMVKKLLQAEGGGRTPAAQSKSATPRVDGASEGKEEREADEDDWDPEKPSDSHGDAAEDDWDPEKPSEPLPPPAANGAPRAPGGEAEDIDDWDPEKPSEPTPPTHTTIPDPAANASTTLIQPDTTTLPTADNTTTNTPQPPLEWGNTIYTIRFPRTQPLPSKPLPPDGIFRPPYGWKYHYSLEEAVNAPEYVVPWEGFRALAEDYGLELLYRKGFREVLEDEVGDRGLGALAERMGVVGRDRERGTGVGLEVGGRGVLVSEVEMEAAGFYHAFCFYKV